MGKLRGSKNQYQWYGRESFNKDWKKWHERNLDVANQLAQLLEKPISEISDLLYNITLQNYSQILNPITKLVSKCDVPYASIDACKQLLTIFDFEGNLRHPSDPESLFRLLQLMQQILRWGSDWEIKQAELEKMQREANLALQTACQQRVPKKSRRRTKKSDNISLSSRSISISTINSKKNFRTKFNNINNSNNSNNKKHIKKRRSRFSTYDRKLFHLGSTTMSLVSKSTIKSIKSIGLLKGKKIRISKLPLPVREFLLMDAKGRRRGLGIKELQMLIKKQKYLLRLLLERNMNDNPDGLLNALILADLDNPKMEIKNQRTVAAEISNFYSAVVSKTPDNISYIKFQVPFIEHFYKSLPRSQKLYNFKREYLPFYDRVAVLFHEPYDHKKPSSWYLKRLI